MPGSGIVVISHVAVVSPIGEMLGSPMVPSPPKPGSEQKRPPWQRNNTFLLQRAGSA